MRSKAIKKTLIALIIGIIAITEVFTCDYSTAERRIHHRNHHRRHFKRNNVNREGYVGQHHRHGGLKKRCRYSENEPRESSGPLASSPKGNFKPFNFIKHYQIRDGQERSSGKCNYFKELEAVIIKLNEIKENI